MNDGIELRQHVDPVQRMSYPVLTTRGGNRNAIMPQSTAVAYVQQASQASGMALPPPRMAQTDVNAELGG